MYRIVKDNHYQYVHILQRKFFGFFWIPVEIGALKQLIELKKSREKAANLPRYTVVE